MNLQELSRQLTRFLNEQVNQKLQKEKVLDENTFEVTQLIQCPLKRELEIKYGLPIEARMPLYLGVEVHGFFEVLVKQNTESDIAVLYIEEPFERDIKTRFGIFNIFGIPDLVIEISGVPVIIDYKTVNRGSYYPKVKDAQELEEAREKLRQDFASKPPVHYLWQLLLYKWLLQPTLDAQLLSLVFITRNGLTSAFYYSPEELKILNENDEEIDLFEEHEDFKEVETMESFIEKLIQRHLERKAPLHHWECDYCWFAKANLCPLLKEK